MLINFAAKICMQEVEINMSAIRALGALGRARMATATTSRRNMSVLPKDSLMYSRVLMKVGTCRLVVT